MPTYYPRVKIERAKGGSFEIDFSTDFYRDCFRAYGRNAQNVEVLAITWVALLSDTPVVNNNKPPATYHRFARALASDAVGLIKNFADLYDRLTRSVIRVDGQITIDFFIEEFKDTPIFWEYLAFYRSGDVSLFRFISSFLLFGKKSYYEDEDFDAQAFRQWIEVEERLGALKFDSFDFLDDLGEITAWSLRKFDDSAFLPKHGSGAVAEHGVRRISRKNSVVDPPIDMLRSFYRPGCMSQEPLLRGQQRKTLHKVSRLKFVPKDIGKSRSICMEPVTLQWAQQGVRLWVEQALAGAEFGAHIPLRNQGHNRDMARMGSVTGKVDTIDLSSASDSVHYDLIKGIMPPKILNYLDITRSDKVSYSGLDTEISVHKFAPMGSALCFPIQSVVYAAVTMYSSLVWLFGKTAGCRLNLNRHSLYHYYGELYGDRDHKLQSFSIYGDDIICDSRITSIVVETLTNLGFVVNINKSFTGDSAFRESCGGYYLNGGDVTPLRAKFGKVSDTITMTTASSLIDLANRAYEYGYLSLRQHLIRIVKYWPIAHPAPRGPKSGATQEKWDVNCILFSDDPTATFAIRSPNPSNAHLRLRKWRDGNALSRSTHVRFQRDEVRSVAPKPDGWLDILSSGDDWYRHIVWWRSHVGEIDNVEIPNRIPLTSGPVWRWTTHAGD